MLARSAVLLLAPAVNAFYFLGPCPTDLAPGLPARRVTTRADCVQMSAADDKGVLSSSRRRFSVGLIGSGLISVLSLPRPAHAVDAQLYKGLNVDDPYLLMEPAGKSFRGNKGPNLQLPDELTEEDEEPEELTAKFQQKPSIDLFDDLSLVELAASTFWGVFLYFGIFDINTRTNELSQASGDLNAVRPSDWLKIKLGSAIGEDQSSWDEDFKAPLAIEAFVMSFFLLLGVAVDRSFVSGAGDASGYFALSTAIVGCLWAGFYELGRMQQTGYRVSRAEQEEIDAAWQAFLDFAEKRLELRPTGRVHISEVNKAFRRASPKYRTSEQLSDDRFKKYWNAYIRPRTGQKGRQGFFKGVALREQASAFGEDAEKLQWKREEEARRQREIAVAEGAAAEAERMASVSSKPAASSPASSSSASSNLESPSVSASSAESSAAMAKGNRKEGEV